MTEHSRIDKNSAGRASLFERANDVFGLDRMGSAAVPANLPPPLRPFASSEPKATPAERVVQDPEVRPQAKPAEAESPKIERAVEFRGPRVAIDRDLLRKEGLIVPEDPVTGLLEEFRIIKRELIADARVAGDAAARRVLVCSPLPGEGKTYCAMNLAIALAAERDMEVVLVDADVLSPSVTRRLGVESEEGLMDALVDHSLRPEDLVLRTDIEGLCVLPAGTSSSRDAEYLTSRRTGEVLDRLTRGAPDRILIFDTPPALAASPAAELAAHVGQALLVARADDTSRAALEDARQLLSACPDIKLLLNATQFSPSGRRFGDYGDRGE